MAQQRHINVEDEVLIQRWRLGDTGAFDRLVGKYQGRIYNLILKICSNPDTAAELTQDTFVKIIENIEDFESRSSFYTWVFRIAVNLALNYRKRKATVGFTSMDTSAAAYDEQAKGALSAVLLDNKTPTPADVAENRELCELVQQALGKLDDDQRAIVVLRDIEGMDYAQIADVLSIELGTVRSRLSRARSHLRDTLESMLK